MRDALPSHAAVRRAPNVGTACAGVADNKTVIGITEIDVVERIGRCASQSDRAPGRASIKRLDQRQSFAASEAVSRCRPRHARQVSRRRKRTLPRPLVWREGRFKQCRDSLGAKAGPNQASQTDEEN